MMSDGFVAAMAFAVGACIGSFLNVCIARWPAKQSVIRPRSRCPGCETEIAWYDNIPIVSWLILRARCRACGVPISVQYPAVEFIVALGWLAAVLAYGPTFTALRVAVFGTVLFGIAVTDLKHYEIPDGFTVFGFLFVIVTSLVAFVRLDVSPFATPWDALIGACTGAGVISIVAWLGEVVLKREAMGFGDVTLMAVIGAAVGPARSLLVVFIGAALGAATFVLIVLPLMRLRRSTVEMADRVPISSPELDMAMAPQMADGAAAHGDGEERGAEQVDLPNVPFGVFLAPAAIVVLLAGERVIAWYMSRTGGAL